MPTINQAKELGIFIAARLAGITKTNGFRTDIGGRVYRGRRNIEARFATPALVLIEGEDRIVDSNPSSAVIVQEFACSAYLQCDPDNPNDAAHDAIHDIKRALFTVVRPANSANFEGAVKKVEYKGKQIGARADGEAVVQAVVHFDVTFAETLTDA